MHTEYFKDTSFRGILKFSMPMMISALSSQMMLILDQLVLAHYSANAMAGATSAFLWSSVIQCIALSTTMIAGVYVGHYNGAKKYFLAGSPVWQMIYFSIFLFGASIPAGLFLGETLIPKALQTEGIPYFKCLMIFSPLTGVVASLCAFFVSIGRGSLVTISVTISNLFNIAANIIFVFGLYGVTCFKGSIGAAMGTVLSWVVNIAFLSYFFFKKEIRKKYGTLNFKLRKKLMKKCLKFGLPGGIGHTFEMAAWGYVYYLIAQIGTETALIQTMAVTVNIFLVFIASGLEKGVMSMTSNLLGAGEPRKIKKLLHKGLAIHLTFASLLFFVFYIFPEIITSQFIRFEVAPETITQAFFVLKLVWVFFVFDGLLWVTAGVIEAGGDINYVTWSIAISLWGFVAIPSALMSHLGTLNIEKIWYLLIMSAISLTAVLYSRYRSGKWVKIHI